MIIEPLKFRYGVFLCSCHTFEPCNVFIPSYTHPCKHPYKHPYKQSDASYIKLYNHLTLKVGPPPAFVGLIKLKHLGQSESSQQ